MSQLIHKAPWYNPLFVEVNGKEYEVSNILFYEGDKIIAQTGKGWFGINNNSVKGNIEIPLVCLRRVIKFDGQTFIVVQKDWYKNPKQVWLYIPYAWFAFKVETNTDVMGYYNNEYQKYISQTNPDIHFIDHSSRKQVIDRDKMEKLLSVMRVINTVEPVLSMLNELKTSYDPYDGLKRNEPDRVIGIDGDLLLAIEDLIDQKIK